MKPFILFLFNLTLLSAAWAGLEIPKNMNSVERQKAVEILGLSSSAKILGNPYPLGGYAGIEIGYTIEVISTDEISRLGSKSTSQSETSFSTLTIGKGLYNNIDLLFQFTPFTQTENITSFGGQVRWGFYQAEYLPANLSVVSSVNSTNFNNQLMTVTQESDLVASFSVQDVTLYTGIGLARSIGTFSGGPSGVTDSGETAREDVSETHYVAGVNIQFSPMFLAMQLDRHSQATYSAKLGFRF